jgi:hypothetical protein
VPIIVDEIVISVEVTNQEAGGGPANAGGLAAAERQTLVTECVERVLDVLQRKEER